jgi:hypothetical protein
MPTRVAQELHDDNAIAMITQTMMVEIWKEHERGCGQGETVDTTTDAQALLQEEEGFFDQFEELQRLAEADNVCTFDADDYAPFGLISMDGNETYKEDPVVTRDTGVDLNEDTHEGWDRQEYGW